MSKHKNQASGIPWGLIGLAVLLFHLVIIAEDVQAVVEDPNIENKPGEVLKLAFDLSRYAGK